MKISINNLKKNYGNQQVLRDLNLTLEGPGITCLMGHSGCGKTTLLRIMMGLEKADGGSVEGMPLKSMGAVFQEDRLLEELDGIWILSLI